MPPYHPRVYTPPSLLYPPYTPWVYHRTHAAVLSYTMGTCMTAVRRGEAPGLSPVINKREERLSGPQVSKSVTVVRSLCAELLLLSRWLMLKDRIATGPFPYISLRLGTSAQSVPSFRLSDRWVNVHNEARLICHLCAGMLRMCGIMGL